MTVELSVGEVRQALARASGSDATGSGEAASLLCGKVFHEVFADLVGPDATKSGLMVVIEAPADPERRTAALTEHTWRRLLGPRLRRHAALLQSSTREVSVLWRATQNLLGWLSPVVIELAKQHPEARGSPSELAKWWQAELPLACDLVEPGWSESVRLVGVADAILRVPGRASYCALELKLGRARPVVDLGQAALYHLILTRSLTEPAASALAMLRFSPQLQEQLVDREALKPAEQRLIELIGRLTGVCGPHPAAQAPPEHSVRPKRSRPARRTKNGAPPMPLDQGPDAGKHGPDIDREPNAVQQGLDVKREPDAYAELGKRLVRAYREQGVGIEMRGAALAGPRFLRFEVRLTSGMRVEALRRRTAEVQHRLELQTEPMVVQGAGHLYIDVEHPEPEAISFASIAAQLPALDPLLGCAKIPIGVSPGGALHLVDLSSSGRSHVLVAGTTGSGKSEWLRMMLAGLAASNTPQTLRLVTLDPKLNAFTDLQRSRLLWNEDAWWIPGCGRPASELFQDLCEEMERRYQQVRESGSDSLTEHVHKTGQPLPRIVCVCDEYFALISGSKQEKQQIEQAVALLGAKARAAGIHLILATQQPSRQTVSGAIQANLPCRVALLLNSRIESTMILGSSGAERLTGSGDLLYKDFGDPVRLQAPLLTATERAQLLSP